MPRLAPARLGQVQRVDQKQRVQTVAAREETRHARKKHAPVAAKAAMRRARMTNADVVRRLAAKVVRHRAAKDVRRLAAKDAQRPATKVVPLPATKVAQHRVARVALAHGWKRRLAVAVTRSRLLRVVDQPSHRVHRDR